MTKLKKTAVIFMLLSFIFSTVSPAVAGAGIAKGSTGSSGGLENIGDKADFVGQNWTLYAKDDTYGYIITTDTMPGMQYFKTVGTAYPTGADEYKNSDIRKIVSGYEGSSTSRYLNNYESQFQNYTGPQMTWAEANGTDSPYESGYITKHTMTDVFGDTPYSDLLYILSLGEMNDLYETAAGRAVLESPSTWYWSRTPDRGSGTSGAFYVWAYVPATESEDEYVQPGTIWHPTYLYRDMAAVRPALQIDLDSPLFTSDSYLFKTAPDGKGAVDLGGGFMLPQVDDADQLTKKTKRTLDFSGTPTYSKEVADVTETVEDRIGTDKVINLTAPLMTGSQLKVTYSGFGTTTDQDHVAAIVSTGTAGSDTEAYVNYAKLSTNMTETDLVVNTSNLENDKQYNLYLFAEKIDNTPGAADAATELKNAGTFTLHTSYQNYGTLAASHAAEGLTANLGGDFNLSFEAGTYDTGVSAADGKKGKITADAADGTTLTGSVSVGNNAELTTANAFTLAGDNTIKGKISGDSLTIAGGTTAVTNTGSIENDLTIQTAGTVKAEGRIANAAVKEGGTLELSANKYLASGGVEKAEMSGGTLKFTGGTLTQTVEGTGTTEIAGNVTTNAKVSTTAYAVGTAGNLTTDAQYIGSAIDNSGIVNLTGGTLDKEITGTGATKIAGNVAANAKVSTAAYTVGTAGKLTTDAQYVGSAIDNSGIVRLTAGTLDKGITGTGTTEIAGNVTTNAAVATALTIDTLGELTTSAGSLGGDVTNRGVVNFTGGTLAKKYTSTGGTTNFKGAVTLNSPVSLTNSNLGFWLDNFSKGDVIVSSVSTVDLSGTKIWLYQDVAGRKVEKEGDRLTLINNAAGYEGTKANPLKKKVISTTGMLDYEYDTWLENNALVMGVKGDTPGPVPVIKDKTKSFSEARLAGVAAINDANDLLSGAVMETIGERETSREWESFAAIRGSRSKYDTGSHIDLNSISVAAGLSKKINDGVTLGIFAEGGNGRYTAYNEFETGDVRADGDVNYFGGGVFLKAEGEKTEKGQLHGEASLRAGHMNSDYNSETFEPGRKTRFDTSNAYTGAHAGFGYKWNVKSGGNVDTYVKYLWSRQKGDSPVINGEQFDLDAISSHRLRAGFRYSGRENDRGVNFFGGLAYEYEFDGKAKGHMGEYALLEPDFKGGSGMAELGIKYDRTDSPWKAEFGVTGYTGKRDSIGANLSAWYEFGGGRKETIRSDERETLNKTIAALTEMVKDLQKKIEKKEKKAAQTVETSPAEKPERPPVLINEMKPEPKKASVPAKTVVKEPKKTSVSAKIVVKEPKKDIAPAKTVEKMPKQAKSAVQIGASQNKGACEGLAAKARKAGFDAKVTTVQKGNATIYRVRVFSDNIMSQPLLKQVKAKGFDGFAVKD